MKYLIYFLLIHFSSVTFAQSQFRYEGYIENGGTAVTAAAQRFTVSLRKPGCASNLGLPAWDSGATIAIVNGEFNLVPSFSEALLSVAMDPNQIFGCTAGSARDLEITWVDQSRTFVVALQDAPRSSFSNLAGNSNTLSSRTQDQFLKIDSYVGQTPLSNAQVNSLLNLVNGTSALYSNSTTAAGGDATGTLGALTVTGLRGRTIGAAVPAVGQILKFNGTSWEPSADDTGVAPGDAGYAAKGVVQFDTSAAVSGVQVTAGVASLANTITAGGPIGNASTVPIITYDSKGRLTNVATAAVNDSTKLPLAGGTMTGPVNMGLQNITNASSVAATNFSGRNLLLNDNDTNVATIRSPLNLTADYALTLPTTAPTNGYFLSTDGGGQLSWTAASAGTVTAVGATAPVLSTGGTTPTISLDTGLGANRVPLVGGAALGANGVVVANGTASALTSLNCALNQVIKFDASGFAVCGTDSGAAGTEFVNGGNSFGTTANVGTNDNFALNLETNGMTRMTVLPNGNVGIGTASPGRIVSVYGANSGDHAIEIVNQSPSPTAYSSFYLGNDFNVGDAGMYLNSSTNTADGGVRSLNLFSLGGNMTFSSNGIENMRILASTGNVGIGTTTPNTILDISGALSQRGIATPAVAPAGQGRLYYDSTLNRFRASQNGGAYADLLTSMSGFNPNQAIVANGSGVASSFTCPVGQVLGFDVSGFAVCTSVLSNGSTFLAANGTAAAPSYSFTGESSTGWWRPAAGSIAASTAGTERLRINNIGNVGIGTTSPSSKLDLRDININQPTVLHSSLNTYKTVSPSATQTADSYAGLFALEYLGSANATTGNIVGLRAYSNNVSGSSIQNMYGIQSSSSNQAFAGAVTNAYGISSMASANASSTVTNAYGGHFSISNFGTITNGYGVYVGPMAGTNSWSFYASDATSPSYFAGHVGIGTISPSNPLTVANTNAVTSGNASSYQFRISNPSVGRSLSLGTASDSPQAEIQTAPVTMPLMINPNGPINGGNVVIGGLDATYTNAKLRVNGQIVSNTATVGAGATADFTNGNMITLNAPGGSAITLANMYPGGEYTLIIADTTSRTYSFFGCTTAYFSPTNGPTTARSVYKITKTDTNCYIDWKTGYN